VIGHMVNAGQDSAH